MIYIRKGREPESLTVYRKQAYATYDGYGKKEELRESLLKDQGYLCAYCMRRIENDRRYMKIEHWKPQSQLGTEAEKLDFGIMLGVCDGCRGSADEYTTCDEHRHDTELFVNPLDRTMMASINYDREGYIKSTDERIEHDLNHVLNLNCKQVSSKIVLNRKSVYEECYERMKKLQAEGNWKKSMLQKVLRYYETQTNGKYREYVGVPLFLLNKYMKRCQG